MRLALVLLLFVDIILSKIAYLLLLTRSFRKASAKVRQFFESASISQEKYAENTRFFRFHDYYQEHHLIIYDNPEGKSSAVPVFTDDRLIPLKRKDADFLEGATFPQSRTISSVPAEKGHHLSLFAHVEFPAAKDKNRGMANSPLNRHRYLFFTNLN